MGARTDKFLYWFEQVVLYIDLFFLVFITGIICLQVFARKAGISLGGTEELARYAYVLFAFLAWPIAALKGSDISITILFDKLPKQVRPVILAFYHTAMAGFAVIATYSLTLNLKNARGIHGASNKWLPLSAIFGIVTFGLAVTVVFNIIRALRLLSGRDVYITQEEKDALFIEQAMESTAAEVSREGGGAAR
ncbi:MAG: TRAP transporter small permease subunit [Treponema sp.]|nr:TRAP transporter small permease subunit [Treponema sp.]